MIMSHFCPKQTGLQPSQRDHPSRINSSERKRPTSEFMSAPPRNIASVTPVTKSSSSSSSGPLLGPTPSPLNSRKNLNKEFPTKDYEMSNGALGRQDLMSPASCNPGMTPLTSHKKVAKRVQKNKHQKPQLLASRPPRWTDVEVSNC